MPSAIIEVQREDCTVQKGSGGDEAREPHGGRQSIVSPLMNYEFTISFSFHIHHSYNKPGLRELGPGAALGADKRQQRNSISALVEL